MGTMGAGSTITTMSGFEASSTLGGKATNCYGFRSAIATASNHWNIYCDGSASNYLAGNLLIGSNIDGGFGTLQVSGSAIVTGFMVMGATIVSRGGASEGGQLVLGYGGGAATSILGQSNNTWNIDVDPTNNLRIFAMRSTGAVVVPMAMFESTGNVAVGGTSDGDGSVKLRVTGISSSTRHLEAVSTLSTGTTIPLDASLGSYFTLTPIQACQINASNSKAGHSITVVVNTSGTTSYNVTFGTNFKSQGILATGTVAAKTFTLTFCCVDGTNYVETGRTVAM